MRLRVVLVFVVAAHGETLSFQLLVIGERMYSRGIQPGARTQIPRNPFP